MPVNAFNTPFRKLFAANVTAASIAAPAVSLTGPSGDGVLDVYDTSRDRPRILTLGFYGVGAVGNTFTAQVFGWRRIGSTWMPSLLFSMAGQLGNTVGVVGGDVLATERFAGILTPTARGTGEFVIWTLTETAASAAASIGVQYMLVDTFASERIEVRVAKGTATSINAIAA